MHTKQWQTVCGFLTDGCESIEASGRTMRELYEAIFLQTDVPVFGWLESKRVTHLRAGECRRRITSAAKQIHDLCGSRKIVGLHLVNGPAWPVCFWAILMSGNRPLLLDSRRKLFDYRFLPQCAGAFCITADPDYPAVISPDLLMSGSVRIDPGFFDDKWEDQVIFADAENPREPKAVVHNGHSLCEQILRFRYLYRDSLPLLYPHGKLHALHTAPFSGLAGLVTGVLLYPYFGCETFVTGETEPVGILQTCRLAGITHLYADGTVFSRIAALISGELARLFPGEAGGLSGWLTGAIPSADYRLLLRYASLCQKLRKRFFGKQFVCALVTDDTCNPKTFSLLNRLGVFFSRLYWRTDAGIVSLDASAAAEQRCAGSCGTFLNGITGSTDSRGILILSGTGMALGFLSDRELVPYGETLDTGQAARIDHRGILTLTPAASAPRSAPADPDPLIQKICELYAAVLNRSPEGIGPQTDFFTDLGGDSLTYFMLLQHIGIAFGITVGPEHQLYMTKPVYAAETVAEIMQKQ